LKKSITTNRNTKANDKRQHTTKRKHHTQLAVLKEYFPACFKSDGSFDVEHLNAYSGQTLPVIPAQTSSLF